MVASAGVVISTMLEKALCLPTYEEGLVYLLQQEHDRVNTLNRDHSFDQSMPNPTMPMFGYLINEFNKRWGHEYPSNQTSVDMVERLKGSTGTLALMSMLAPETTLGQFREALMQVAKDLTGK